jgi:hypothetical protein
MSAGVKEEFIISYFNLITRVGIVTQKYKELCQKSQLLKKRRASYRLLKNYRQSLSAAVVETRVQLLQKQVMT